VKHFAPRSGALPFALAVLTLAAAGCSRPLPEQGSAAERLYSERCGNCHRPYQPRSLTAAMWQVQVAAMRQKIAAAGQPPLTPAQDREILEYLRRNAGEQ
jgi:hypothetical protein